jgi:hypothetical protein
MGEEQSSSGRGAENSPLPVDVVGVEERHPVPGDGDGAHREAAGGGGLRGGLGDGVGRVMGAHRVGVARGGERAVLETIECDN